MTTAIACGGDDGGEDDTASTDPTTTDGPTTEPTTSMTATTSATMTTDATETGSTETLDPDTGTTDPTEDPTEDPTTGDPDTGTTGDPAGGCAAYCTAFLATCQDAEGAGLDGADPYVDEADCLTQCETITPDDGTPMGGNDLECRLYHVGVAAVMMGAGHCGHADIDGTGVCA